MEFLHFFGHKKMIFAGYQRSYLNCTIENHGQNQSVAATMSLQDQ